MVLSASEGDSLIITEEHIKRGLEILQGVESDMLQVFNSIGKPVTTRHMDIVLAYVKVNRSIEKPALWKAAMSSMSWKELDDAIDGLIKAERIAIRNELGIMKIYYTKSDDDEKENEKREEVQRNAYAVRS